MGQSQYSSRANGAITTPYHNTVLIVPAPTTSTKKNRQKDDRPAANPLSHSSRSPHQSCIGHLVVANLPVVSGHEVERPVPHFADFVAVDVVVFAETLVTTYANGRAIATRDLVESDDVVRAAKPEAPPSFRPSASRRRSPR